MFKLVILYIEKVQWYFKEIDSKNIYTKSVKNKKIVDF